MASSNKVFVSPGVYTSERDLSFVTRNVGVTTLGLVGETVKGPAFQPIFVTNYDEFRTFFGGLNPEKIKDTGYPKYELPYISKSYLSESNQLFVTRVLGHSGYNAGCAWGITVNAAVNEDTKVSGGTVSYNELIKYELTSGGTLNNNNIVINDPYLDELYNDGVLSLDFLEDVDLLDPELKEIGINYTQSGATNCDYIGASTDMIVSGSGVTGSTTGVTMSGTVEHYTAKCYEDIDNKLVALLRSRARYGASEELIFDLCRDTGTSVGIDGSVTTAVNNPKGAFNIVGTTDSSDPSSSFDYEVSFDKTNKNYLPRVLGRTADDGKTALFVEELYGEMFSKLEGDGKIKGINLQLIEYNDNFNHYLQKYQSAVTPFIVSELIGGDVRKLFRLHTISDGNAANKEFKVSITNIKLDDRVFDVEIRAFNDTDKNKVVLEKFSKCTMNPASDRFIGRRIGTLDGEYVSKSNFVLVELSDESDTSDSFPAGFMGYPIRDYTSNSNGDVTPPNMIYNVEYGEYAKKKKVYLGISDLSGYDQNFFNYKGYDVNNMLLSPTGLTDGFHMDKDAGSAKINNVSYGFQTGSQEFKNDFGVESNLPDGTSNPYKKVYARKFTLAPYGGFDGWDIYRDKRTNDDGYRMGGTKSTHGLNSGVFENDMTTTEEQSNTSDYYSYFEGIRTFSNSESTNVNVFATPGLDVVDNTSLIYEAIDMVENERADSLYIITSPDLDGGGEVITPEDAVLNIEDEFDSSYSATYWPWVQVNDSENSQLIWLPPTRDVVRNIALTDNIAFPWFAAAGIQRGDVKAIKSRINLTQEHRDTLYEGRINPVATWSSSGVKIWGNKTLQEAETALNRVNVRRLLLQARKLISAVSIRLLFEQNDEVVKNQFLGLVNPILDNIRSERGLTDFRVVLDDDPEAMDRNELCGKIYIKPTRALEFICVEFNVMNTGASFDDI